MNVMPITEARNQLGKLAEKVNGENTFVLTKSGRPWIALVDIDYLTKLQETVDKIYQKTYIDPNLLPFTRKFSQTEIEKWLKEDQL